MSTKYAEISRYQEAVGVLGILQDAGLLAGRHAVQGGTLDSHLRRIARTHNDRHSVMLCRAARRMAIRAGVLGRGELPHPSESLVLQPR